MSPQAVVFDLYGTLIRLEHSAFGRAFPRRLGVTRRDWAAFVRRVLLVTPFDSREAFVERGLGEFSATDSRGLRTAMLELLAEEIDSARPFAGVLALLRFLKRRGLRLGLISNLASPYREPVERLGFGKLFDAVAFSCDLGRAKPDERLYLGLCERLGVAPRETLVVGDSPVNDVAAPRRLGMRSLRIGDRWQRGETSAFGVGWLDLPGVSRWLLRPGQEIELDGQRGLLKTLEAVRDDEQGRYNLLARGTVEWTAGSSQTVYFKRFLLPESAAVEAFVHALLAEIGIATTPAGILSGRESVFWSFEVAGRKLDRCPPPMTPELAAEVGRHSAAAFLLANADLRPRNTFVLNGAGRPRLVTIDHEHCLFSLALKLEGIADPLDPHALDRLGKPELERRVGRRVVTPALMRRVRRMFFDTRGATAAQLGAFRRGWLDVHDRARQRRAHLLEIMRRRIYRRPFLVIGTRAYRRAMAGIDLDAFLARLDLDPEEAVAQSLEGPRERPHRRPSIR